MDGLPLVNELNGNALNVNPGRHEFSFRLAPYPTQIAIVVLRSGEKERIVAVAFRSETRTTPKVLATPRSSGLFERIAWPTYAFAAVALAGAGIGLGAGLSAQDLNNTARRTCAPFCNEATVERIKYRGYLADAGFAAALASGATAIWFALRDTEPNSLPVSLLPIQQGALLSVGGAF
jgi:hypothetical protein